MATVLERPATVPASALRRRPARGPGRTALAGSLRFAAFAALVLYGCEHWVRQVAPTPGRTALQMAGVAVGAAVLLVLAGRVPGARRRRVLVGLLGLGAAVLGLAAAGIPVRFVGWHNWRELGTGVGEGLTALPNLNVPYRGLDPWVRWTILSGAALLGVLAAGLAFAGRRGTSPGARRQVGAALALGALYGIPVVERNPEQPFLSGAGFAVLLALYLGADRLVAVGGARPRLITAGAALLALAVAALAAPQLDGARPWVDYRGLADDLAERNQTTFDWNHSYSPLDWPRDGREVLRVKARHPSYWKATVLRRFDGIRWVADPRTAEADLQDTPEPSTRPEWNEDLKVTVRGLSSEQYVTAGYATGISDVPRPARQAGSGTYVTAGRPLRPGDTYTASVYAPRPTPRQLELASTVYPEYVLPDLTLELPEDVGGPSPAGAPGDGQPLVTTILFPFYGTSGPPSTFIPGRPAYLGGEDLLERSRYGRMYRLARQLRDASTSPLDLVRRVRRRVQAGATYTERPAQRDVPLDAFLFDTHEGYCQQFSGAMALLLRMAGVPARIASGFTPGSFDSDRGQYVVRDLDAHSWVEAFFPDLGWVTFDPTPSVAPPASQEAGDGDTAAAPDEPDEAANRADVPERDAATPDEAAGGSGTGGGGTPPVLVAGLGLLAAAVLGGGAWWWRRPHVALPPLEELRRALVRSGRPAAPGTTLVGLERALGGSTAAQAYVRKLRDARYAGAEVAPTRAERSALRDELAAGLGLRGRLRALWALPPRLPTRS